MVAFLQDQIDFIFSGFKRKSSYNEATTEQVFPKFKEESLCEPYFA